MPYYAHLEPVTYVLRVYVNDNRPPYAPFEASGTVTASPDGIAGIKGFCMPDGYNSDVWRAVNDALAREGFKMAVFDRRKADGAVRMVRVPVQHTAG